LTPTPFSHWIYFHAGILLLLAVEYLIAHILNTRAHKAHQPLPTTRKAILSTILWIAAALALAALLVRPYGSTGSVQYLAGYAIEEALSIDNLFLFLLLFGFFRIPPERQPRVLFWGVAGAILLRGAFIAAGLGLLARFHWVSYVFAAILLLAAIRLLKPAQPHPDPSHCPAWLTWLSRLHPVSPTQDHFFVREPVPGHPKARPMMTVLFLALLAVELTDVVFALDSIPAVLSITRQPFLAYTSNIMAVMGLRSLYVLLAALLSRLRFLHFGLAALLGFAALKMLAANWIEIGPLTSLGVIATVLSLTITASLLWKPQPSH
jgi:tellurite resistance protein TerC